jgi:hypothetical protein
MEYGAEVLEAVSTSHPRRRRFPRHTLRTLAYVTFDNGNGGIIRDLTEAGVAVQAVARLRPGQEVTVRFELLSPRVRLEARGRVRWATSGGQAGVEFVDVGSRNQRALRNWQLTQMFVAATVSGRDSMFSDEPFVRDLTFSTRAKPAIVVESRPAEAIAAEVEPFRWKFITVPANVVSIAIDGVILLIAAVLFAISAVMAMGEMPPLPIATVFFLSSSTIFVAVYQALFSVASLGTPGRWVTRAARRGLQEDLQRFR